MRPLTEDDVRDSFVNAAPEEVTRVRLPADFVLTEWDHTDFFAWRDPQTRGRGYMIAEVGGEATGVVLRASSGSTRPAMCNLCHTMQPGDQVALFTARKAGDAGENGDSIGTYICADLSCHENVRLAAPLAPNEIRASVDRRIDGTRQRAEALVTRVAEAA
ncbi:FBP domain-containing protein [Microbacterium xanthum]|uniref:FBP domain-containing protein n=1 Tax=Microbacterium xanthum TaxID=3079794 RepID=UPI002AD37C7A|nr:MULTISPECIES: FBP domain-containing protein [unclassified Microbacterium]MDZ8171778.1 FBP domain-containing protein [Microbacterium sp. KSW-48]MDZ8200119.1 FBP domain-containing protein [Microbacterium sp. SSW1-59]